MINVKVEHISGFDAEQFEIESHWSGKENIMVTFDVGGQDEVFYTLSIDDAAKLINALERCSYT